ncbi:hypothetical protein ACRRTK_019321 [Alexandromys fortis]
MSMSSPPSPPFLPSILPPPTLSLVLRALLLLPGGSCSAGGLGSLASCSLLLAYKCSLNQ